MRGACDAGDEEDEEKTLDVLTEERFIEKKILKWTNQADRTMLKC